MTSFQPVIIIGAARSGTNMLRDLLAQMPDSGTWPCDEINYIWRHGNAHFPTDEFPPDLATEPVRQYVRKAFDNIASRQGIHQVVEKTCANSLRVGFVERILPTSIYISIVRDGRDVVASSMKRWTASLDFPYILRKARFVPYSDIPYYASRYLRNRIHRLTSVEKRLASWGPRFMGMEEALSSNSLAEVCAIQWKLCVERSEQDLAFIQPGRIHHMYYEEFVQDPVFGIDDLAKFLGMQLPSAIINKMAQSVSSSSVGKWHQDLSEEDQAHIEPILKSTLEQYKYA